MYSCSKCNASFSRNDNLERHMARVHGGHVCDICGDSFAHYRQLNYHIERRHRGNFKCGQCLEPYQTQQALDAHVNQEHTQIRRYNLRPPTSPRLTYQTMSNANSMEVVRLTPKGRSFNSPIDYKRYAHKLISYLVKRAVDEKKAIKWHIRFTCEFIKSTNEERFVTSFNSLVQIAMLRNHHAINASINQVFNNFIHAIEEFEASGSGWELDVCGSICDLYLARYRPIRGSGYLPLPSWLKEKMSIINIKNDGEDCFTLCVLAALHPQLKDAQRPSKYDQYRGELDCSMLDYPTSIEEIEEFEEVNKLSIDVYGVDGEEIVPLRISQKEWKVVTLLYLENGEKQHYCLIKDLNAFMRTSRHGTNVCRKCLMSFNTKERLDKHTCGDQIKEFPNGETIKFNNIRKRLRMGMSFVADIETLIRPVQGPQPNPSKSFTTTTAQHEVMLASARGVYQCCGLDTRKYLDVDIYRGKDAVDLMIKRIIDYGMQYQDTINFHTKKMLPMTMQEEIDFKRATHCPFCEMVFGIKCKDHCHLCGRYRMPLCKECNEPLQISRNVHVYLHNFSGFDSTFIAPSVAKIAKERKYGIECLARGGDNFIEIKMEIPFKNRRGDSKKWRLCFLDTMSFLPSSLSLLAESLKKEGKHKFHATIDAFGDDADFLTQKQVIPYTYFDDESKLDESQLPSIEAFKNDLTGEELDYGHAQMVWNKMGCKTLLDYYSIYLACDINLLLDVWENYRTFTLEHYQLDAARYVTGPSLSYSAMLLMTKVELELVEDEEMYDMISSGIRGGLSVVSNRLEYSNEGE